MSVSKPDQIEALRLAMSKLDYTFSQGLEAEMAELFSEDARLMWPGEEDIVGREAITSAFAEFFGQFTTLSYLPDRQIVEVCGNKVFIIGRFIEDFVPKTGGQVQRVHGRLVELWSQTENSDWKISLLLTGRYAENEMLP